MLAHQLITSTAVLAFRQAPVVVQVRSSRGLDLTQVAIGALAAAGLLLALAGTWLLFRRRTDINQRQGGQP